MDTKKLDTGSRDAISWLPGEVLCNILSLLPMKHAASTSLLSKKWLNVFRLVDSFDFDGSVLLLPHNDKRERGESFRNFLDRTQCDSPIKKFVLKRHIGDDSEMAYVVVQCSRSYLYVTRTYRNPFCISNHSIKKLSVHYDAESEIDYMSGLSFDTPSLVFLDYFDYALHEYTSVNLESLVEARLDICYSKKITRPDISGLITGISNVKTLHLSPDSVDVICRYIIHGLLLPVFNNLVNLSFGSKNTKQGRGWKLLPKLLELSPKLETLIIQDLNGYTGDVFMPLNHLKVLHILGYRGTSQELKHLRSFLGKTECLELLQVNVKEAVVDDDIIILKTKKELMMLLGTSVSPKCQIKVT
ncbi:F-box domain [Arabidopsis thaliana x Arabidopsis arenosa]|uniref:F-box domain n=1 Tax=Arabidopsis thaliana x Arabidopsis arenosa TaxID=1240361 RepID=A0A8T1ZSK8_9BRAS|nr:F-box domain [Arabidopsis thaliana x Arabidopsis arenosa]